MVVGVESNLGQFCCCLFIFDWLMKI
jgi:hypothetical protein